VTERKKVVRESLTNLIRQVDARPVGEPSPDTVPTGFPSVDKVLGGGFRRRDLIALGGDVGSGKSALALGIAIRTARAGFPVVFFSGEMDADRLMERALAIEGRSPVDDMRNAALSEQARADVGAAAHRIRDVPLSAYSLTGQNLDEALAAAWRHDPALVVVDSIQLLPPGESKAEQVEQVAATVLARAPRERDDPRPTLDDFGALGSVKQHADVVLNLYREEMYRPGGGVEGATELLIAKNRNGMTGFVDLYFYQRYLRFEDMLDPD